MKMTKKTTFIALLLLVTTFNTYSMEPAAQYPQWVTFLGMELLDEGTFPDIVFNDLQQNVRTIVLNYLLIKSKATSVQKAGKAINDLALANNELNLLINDPQFCLQTIKHLAKKFNCSDETAAQALGTTEAERRLTIQKKAIKSTKNAIKGSETPLPQEIDANFTYNNPSENTYNEWPETRILLTYVFKDELNVQRISAKNIDFIINLIARSHGVINYQNITGQTILHIFLACIDEAQEYGGEQKILNNPTNKSYLLKIIKTFLNTGANAKIASNNGTTPFAVAQKIGDQDIINLINNAIEQKHSTKRAKVKS